jgi:peptidoglycan/LPS O-acetylase OafA/YrhL
MAAATLFAAALFSLLPEAHLQAGAQAGSTWLQVIGPATISLASIIHNIVFEGLLAGFHGFSLLPAWISRALNLSTTDQAFDTPLWTLHIELVGSLLVAMLVLVRRSASQTAYRITCLILGCSFVLSPLVLFILGHLVASRLRNPEAQSSHKSLGPALMMSGILLCTIRPVYPIMILWKFLPPPLLGIQCGHPDLQRIIGVMLVFGGLALLPPLQRQLQRHLPQWLGKVSFSLYLTHLPLELTCVAAGFSQLARVLPVGASVAVASVTGIAGSLALAVLFERWIDRPAIILSRIASQPRRRLIAPQPAVRVP